MSFIFNKCVTKEGKEIEGLYEVLPNIYGDNRGYFFEAYNEKDFCNAGLNMSFVQDNQSLSTKGVLRGLHFQTKNPQGKLVRILCGKVYDVAVDLRKNSETFGKYCGIILDSEKNNQFYIPEGFAHGFYTLSDTAVCSYKCNAFYDPNGESGIMWNDPVLNINWNEFITDNNPILSEKDKNHPLFSIDKDYFNINGSWIGEGM